MIALRRSLATLVLMVAAGVPNLARADDDNDNKRIISLAAMGSIKTAPDKVDILTGVTSQAPSAKDALAKNSAAMGQVIDALKGEGLEPKDIQTTNFSVRPISEEREEGRASSIIAYQVTNSLRITVHDIHKLGAILDKVVTLGANDVGSIEFGVSDPEALREEARKQAVSQATANAKLYAEAVGGTLGKVLTIAEDEGMAVTRYASSAPVGMAPKAVPIEAGTATVEVRVRMTFKLE
jgi:uncharacterized protein YggE